MLFKIVDNFIFLIYDYFNFKFMIMPWVTFLLSKIYTNILIAWLIKIIFYIRIRLIFLLSLILNSRQYFLLFLLKMASISIQYSLRQLNTFLLHENDLTLIIFIKIFCIFKLLTKYLILMRCVGICLFQLANFMWKLRVVIDILLNCLFIKILFVVLTMILCLLCVLSFIELLLNLWLET